ncbi:AMP-binding protein [Amniculibacterium sp. G2-70]|uniref:AMP-binding protein n=1 Tax=Amniculibacterium sp. G2-70 TaxID=2767188 RepID=UPI0016546F2B|nr:AMP-binding protein [Amniculibacterium sp. G2-70]
MWCLDFNSLETNDLHASGDFEENVVFFCNDWFSASEMVEVQTSGSTSEPKKMRIEKSRMKNSAQMTCDFLKLKNGNTALLALPVEYISGKMMLVRAIERKLKIFITQPSLYPLSELNENIDFCALTPLQVEHSLDQLHKIKIIIIGGAAVSENLKQKIHQHLLGYEKEVRVFETYGMTETLSHIALKQIFPKSEEFFTAFDGVALSLDFRGCLRISAPKLHDQALQTNDVVEIFNGNQFKFLGRADFVINSGGAKIFPEELERKVKSTIENELVFLGLEDEVLGQKLVLVVECKGCSEQEKQQIKTEISEINFEKSFHKPKEIIFINEIPRTKNGKVSRLKLLEFLKS